MRTHTCQIVLVTAAVLLAGRPSTSEAQAVVEQQTIQITGGGGAGPIQLPGLMGNQRQFKTGTGRIRGRVLATDGTGPIRRAQVRITSPDIAPKVALTDAQGRFEFRELPASRFTLQATKSGYVSVQFGQTRPFESGKPLELADKQALDNADINMPRGSVISGRIVDEFGDPIPDVSVTAMRQSWVNGRRRLTPSPGRIAQTNDLGQYRIFGLPPGEYYVSASLRGGTGPLDAMAMMETELMMVSAASTSGPSASAPRSGYAPTYYPGTPNAGEAQRIALAPGQEASGSDFGLVAVRLARVSGIVIGSDGKPLEGAAISVMPAARDLGGIMAPASARSTKDGSFTLNNVPPGDYSLQARSVQVLTSTQGDNLMVFRAVSMSGGESEFGSTPLTIAGEDLSNVLLTTSRGGTATGTVVFDGPKPPSITSIRVMSMPADADGPMLGGGGSGVLKEDGSFELKGLMGTRLVRVANPPPGWTVKSVKLNGADITDTGADFKIGETTAGLEIELTNKSTAVNGSVTASDGSLLKDYTVVIFSESPEHWRLPMTRWVTGTRPDQEGRFKVQNLPAGHYLAVAVDYVPQGEWGDPELLDRLKSKGKRFSLSEGATETLDLKLTREY
jgi:protocatechuate 3,4-dioxygenase beta subunit